MRARAAIALSLPLLVACVAAPSKSHKLRPPARPIAALPELTTPPPLPPRVVASETPEAPTDLLTLQPGVVMTITVTGVPSLAEKHARVGDDGQVSLAYLGQVRAAGLTPVAFAHAIAEAYQSRGFVKAADVQVEVLDASGRKVYVLGRVKKPGAYDLPFHRRVHLTQVLAMAGGVDTHKYDLEADTSALRLIRTVDGERRTYRISLLEIVDEGKLDLDAVIRDGDVIYVPPKRELFIFGSVRGPGGFALADGSRLGIDEALGLAGGFSENADPAKILLIRRGAQGGTTYRIPVDPSERAGIAVTANDTIIVPSRRVSKVYVLGSVTRQGGIPLEQGLTVTQALAQSGGLSRIAAANSVQLIRASGGKKRVYSVPVADIIDSGDLSQDPLLQPGDLIWVPEGIF